ncbi:hypothetical protein ACIPY2_13850 [Paenarthrobacter sp. NPDC089675]|uniref:hypothetical protein n=1 Tax=Paenarthrobacter sp. NPDC089675 TaxID=3364376 RepID=UPI00380A5C18
MVISRQLLFRSAVWEIARPRHPLTAGHVLIRLSDPSTEFSGPSAADWLRCHNLARAALRDVLGAAKAVVMFAHRWHPLGAALGEPVAESSTPTFHLFARWADETTTPGRQLALPAHRRLAVPEPVLGDLDEELRESLRFFADGPLADVAPEAGHFDQAGFQRGPATGVVPFTVEAPLQVGLHAPGRHCLIRPASGAGSIAALRPDELLGIADALAGLPMPGGVSGLSCVAVEAESSGEALSIHAVGRSGAEPASPLLDLFRLPEVSVALL